MALPCFLGNGLGLQGILNLDGLPTLVGIPLFEMPQIVFYFSPWYLLSITVKQNFKKFGAGFTRVFFPKFLK
jgi:hypothetical protein